MKYKLLIPDQGEFKDLMDTMQELIPIEWNRDRIGTMLSWLRECREADIINYTEYSLIQQELIHGCGGY
jgi:hypothetical protein